MSDRLIDLVHLVFGLMCTAALGCLGGKAPHKVLIYVHGPEDHIINMYMRGITRPKNQAGRSEPWLRRRRRRRRRHKQQQRQS
jgi:hypothetical protein